jgi:hypothetical protein
VRSFHDLYFRRIYGVIAALKKGRGQTHYRNTEDRECGGFVDPLLFLADHSASNPKKVQVYGARNRGLGGIKDYSLQRRYLKSLANKLEYTGLIAEIDYPSPFRLLTSINSWTLSPICSPLKDTEISKIKL